MIFESATVWGGRGAGCAGSQIGGWMRRRNR